MSKIQWPDRKSFAFTIFDDTDLAAPGNYEAVYNFLTDLGFRTTKSIWPISGPSSDSSKALGGATCEDSNYLDFVKTLQARGFEIGYHNTSFSAVPRQEIERGLQTFRRCFGTNPRSMSNHADSQEAVYWGPDRLSGLKRTLYNGLTRNRHKGRFLGHVENSRHFWGDLCLQNIDYVRNFITNDINTLKAFPQMPYYDSNRPFVKAWYGSSEGPEVHSFNKTISEENQDRLESEGGACIMYTHLAVGFQDAKGNIQPRFKELMIRLSKKNGLFIPVSPLLDVISKQNAGIHQLTSFERFKLESKWLIHKARVGGTS